MVRARQAQVIQTGAIYSSRPINWCFRRVPEYERDSDTPEKGVGVKFNEPMIWLSESNDDKSAKARQGITVILDDFLNRASLKFAGYPDCLRIFVLEAYGDNWIVTDDDIEQAIQNAVLPQNVDKIWLAEPKWITETDFEVAYRQVRANAAN